MAKFKISNRDIRRLRDDKRPLVEKELRKLVETKETFKGTY